MPDHISTMRFDSIPVDETYFTKEGYFIDHPIVTSTGIFEYKNPDGSIRRELRLAEEVFDPASLDSYEGKPVIVTHEAGLVTKDNVDQEYIGTVLSKGYQDGEKVRAKIIIHNTDSLSCGLRELSLGYNMELDKTPGEWNGQPYDAIQRGIRINHLALVANARAGDSARLNLDGKNPENKGGTQMGANSKKTQHRADGFTPEEIQAAIEAYKARKTERTSPPNNDSADENTPTGDSAPEGGASETKEVMDAEETVQTVKDRRDRRDALEDPDAPENAMGVIAQQDEDIESLLQLIAQMLARQDEDDTTETKTDEEGGDPPPVQKDDATAPPAAENKDSEDKESGAVNMDSADYIVRQRLEVARLGDKLRLDGLDALPLNKAKERIIKKVWPSLRFDSKDPVKLDTAYNIARAEIAKRKISSTDSQRKQMFDPVQVRLDGTGMSSSKTARDRMISRLNGGSDK